MELEKGTKEDCLFEWSALPVDKEGNKGTVFLCQELKGGGTFEFYLFQSPLTFFLLFSLFFKLECEMYAPRAHMRKGALRPHFYYYYNGMPRRDPPDCVLLPGLDAGQI